jgi:hypothetical protein
VKYTAKVTQEQYIRTEPGKKIKISPKGGDLTSDEVKAIAKTDYGKSLLDSGILKVEGYGPSSAPEAPTTVSGNAPASAGSEK